ncbi:CAP domain-containing protein [Streptomyces sp. FIT100]|uniref:CAP domain-containing protein n=1 Tax=Streptomyces sp. FIT100 TaxID=2837956 RepID=UPI0021C891DD|nr:CAP domain-containing protein [Streptomyces sp. FIT100]UUN29384.1 CAP domain-containing protein [Streptomyces sp. FIT100]
MGRHRLKKRVSVPVRTGLLGVSAAVAVGAVAVASGLVPGGEKLIVGGSSNSAQQVRESASGRLDAQGGASATPSDRPSAAVTPTRGTSATTGTKPSASPSKQPTKAPEAKKPAAPVKTTPVQKAPAAPAKPSKTATRAPERKAPPAPVKPVEPIRPKAPTTSAAMEAEVLRMVNEERAKVGCSPVRADSSLAALAGGFSADMAARGFFDHTDPDGDDPWERAAQAGVGALGGENIARGQADAETVMRSWMNSDGHRANIVNCEYRTLGVGVYFADGGPWWTQDFGF